MWMFVPAGSKVVTAGGGKDKGKGKDEGKGKGKGKDESGGGECKSGRRFNAHSYGVFGEGKGKGAVHGTAGQTDR